MLLVQLEVRKVWKGRVEGLEPFGLRMGRRVDGDGAVKKAHRPEPRSGRLEAERAQLLLHNLAAMCHRVQAQQTPRRRPLLGQIRLVGLCRILSGGRRLLVCLDGIRTVRLGLGLGLGQRLGLGHARRQVLSARLKVGNQLVLGEVGKRLDVVCHVIGEAIGANALDLVGSEGHARRAMANSTRPCQVTGAAGARAVMSERMARSQFSFLDLTRSPTSRRRPRALRGVECTIAQGCGVLRGIVD